MSDMKTRTSVADELKTVAKRLRCDHRYPCQPPHGQVWAPGPCLHCGQEHPDDDEIVPEALCEPLAAWLEETARQYEAPPCDDPTGVCNGCERRDDFVLAEAVARALNGAVS